MSSEFRYEERSAPPELAGLVRCVWYLTGPALARGRHGIQPIVPDGCPEIVLNVADPFVQIDAEGMARQPRSMLVGQLTRSAFVGPEGVTRIAGIRFLPWGASRFLGMPMAEVRDAFLPLDSVIAGGMEELADRLAASPPEGWAETIFESLRNALKDRLGSRRPLSKFAVEEISSRAGRVSVRMLARRLHVSERHLERVMRRDVGLPPIILARILRLQAALQVMRGVPCRPLGEVAVRAGYYDQSHMVREFRRLVGCSPSQLRAAEYELTSHFIAESPIT
jgi:AraC-like DNA-binding protein